MMSEIIKAIVLGVVQGVTEFLPVSSSGHLVIAQSLLQFNSPGVLFEAVLHLGTLVAIVLYYRKYLFSIKISEIKLYIFATIPAVIAGFLFKDLLESLFDSTTLVGISFFVTAAIVYNIDRLEGRKGKVDSIDAWAIGFAQIFALIPGVSRSGTTILAGKASKLDGESAARFSLVMSIPAILGANVLEIYSHGFTTTTPLSVFIIGFICSLIAGVFSIKLLVSLLNSRRMKYFSYYLIIVAIFSIFFV